MNPTDLHVGKLNGGRSASQVLNITDFKKGFEKRDLHCNSFAKQRENVLAV